MGVHGCVGHLILDLAVFVGMDDESFAFCKHAKFQYNLFTIEGMHKVNSRSTCFNEKPFFIFFVCGK